MSGALKDSNCLEPPPHFFRKKSRRSRGKIFGPFSLILEQKLKFSKFKSHVLIPPFLIPDPNFRFLTANNVLKIQFELWILKFDLLEEN